MRAFWALALLAVPALAKLTTGHFYSHNNQWALVDTFLFDRTEGKMMIRNVNMARLNLYPNQQFLLYHDLPADGFPAVYKSRHSCRKKVSLASKVMNLTGDMLTEVGSPTATKTIAPRTWYLVLANCDVNIEGPEGVGVMNMEIEWKNGDSHLGTNERGFQPMLGFSVFALILLIGVAGFLYWRLQREEGDLAHQVMLTLAGIMAFHLLGVLLSLMHWASYSKNGVGLPALKNTALGLELVPPLLLVALFVVVAKGKYITSESLRDDMRTICEIITMYFVVSVGLLYWSFQLADPGLNLFAYESDAGICLIVLRMLLMLWFVRSLQRTFKREAEKFRKNFYVGFAVFGSLWFLSYPIIVLISESIAYYYRPAVLFVLDQTIQLITYAIFLVLFGTKRAYLRKRVEADDGHLGGQHTVV